MPHYRNGRPAEKFDLVVHSPNVARSNRSAGIIVGIMPGSTTCTASMHVLARQYESEGPWLPQMPNPYPECVTLSECDLLMSKTGELPAWPQTEDSHDQDKMPVQMASAPAG